MTLDERCVVRVDCLAPSLQALAAQLARKLELPQQGEAHLALQITEQGLQLQELGPSAAGPVRVDFVEGALAHRRQFGGGAGQSIAKACGLQPGIRPYVLDATAGLGRDAFVLASLGCRVSLLERQPVVAALLADGLERARLDLQLAPIIERMSLIEGDSIDCLRSWAGTPPEVIYLDPMFPEREKTALVKKEMRLFKPLVGADLDAPKLLEAALALASHRVVIKRPRKAPPVAGTQPSYALEGKSSRFDIYPKKKLS